ncbi:hypothetical protein MHB44_05485 [Lysinibacillus sp. FSL H8-0500]
MLARILGYTEEQVNQAPFKKMSKQIIQQQARLRLSRSKAS